ncbi:MAG: hypothetical protein SRB2_01918 [Desulfobacteraceae bacterium Eth-SRB2]|nr:MAG: hypothetical protein SRB2_01918 [Desulfobacteraceae bacterium Eth-SRB2]
MKNSRPQTSLFSACYNLERAEAARENDNKECHKYLQGYVGKSNLLLVKKHGIIWVSREVGTDEAISCFRRAVAFAPYITWKAWNNGVAQDGLNMIENASKSYRKAIEIRSDYSSAHLNLGISLQKLRRIQGSRGTLQQGAWTRPDDEAARFMLQSLGISATPDAARWNTCVGSLIRCAGTF